MQLYYPFRLYPDHSSFFASLYNSNPFLLSTSIPVPNVQVEILRIQSLLSHLSTNTLPNSFSQIISPFSAIILQDSSVLSSLTSVPIPLDKTVPIDIVLYYVLS